jgi:hypothetical protein
LEALKKTNQGHQHDQIRGGRRNAQKVRIKKYGFEENLNSSIGCLAKQVYHSSIELLKDAMG